MAGGLGACGTERSDAARGGASATDSTGGLGGAGAGNGGSSASTAGAPAGGAAIPSDAGAGGAGFCGDSGPCVYFRENFDTSRCAPGWRLQGFWRCGVPDEILQPPANSVPHVLVSSGAGPDGPYAGVASSPPIDLSLAGQPLLEFYVSMKASRDDEAPNGYPYVSGLRVRARVGEEVFELPNVDPIYTGRQTWSESLEYSFARHRIDLSAFSGRVIRLDFEFVSEYDAGDRVLLDNVSVYDASLVPAVPESLAVPRCMPNATRCAQSLTQMCSPGGTWQTTEDCPFICTDGGTCGGSCRPYQSSCDPAHPSTRLVCEGSGWAEVEQTCLDECAAGHCVGVYFDEAFEGPTAPPGWILASDWGIANAPGLAPVKLPEDGSCLAGRITKPETRREYADDFAQSPELDLTSATEPVLHFLAYLLTETGKSGFNVWVRTNDGEETWQPLTPEYPAYDEDVDGVPAWSGLKLVFRHSQVDLTPYIGHKISLRFALASDGTNQGDASVYIDRASVMERPLVPLSIPLPPTSRFEATSNQPFSAQMQAIGGSSRALWSIVSRTNADWVSIDAKTGVLSGLPSSRDAKVAGLTVRVEEPGVKKANFAELGIEVEIDAEPAP